MDLGECYLKNSNVFDNRVLEEDKLSIYLDLMKDDQISSYFKRVFKTLSSYKISFLKFNLNLEYFEGEMADMFDFMDDKKEIAPSLKIIKKDKFKRPLGYPNWFYAAFPDVLLWAVSEEGIETIRGRFEKYSNNEIAENNEVRHERLVDIIKLYQLLGFIGPQPFNFECKKY